jgi:hypothetical protein
MRIIPAAVISVSLFALPALAQTQPQAPALEGPVLRGGQAEAERDVLRRTPTDSYNRPREYEGRATFVGARLGKCAPHGRARATVMGNRIDARVTFPIESGTVNGTVSGSRIQAAGPYGYSMEGNVNEGVINGVVTKRISIVPTRERPIGVPIPFLYNQARPAEPEVPKAQNCVYKVSLDRVP